MSRSAGPSGTPETLRTTESPLLEEGFLIEVDNREIPDLQIPTTVLPETAYVAGAKVEITLELPHEVLDDVPLGIVHGYGGVQSAYAAMRNYVARNGKPAFTYEPPRSQHWWVNLGSDHLFHPDKLLSQAAWSATKSAMKMMRPAHTVECVDLVGHSMGGPTSTRLAELRPDYTKSVSYLASAGLDGHNIIEMVLNRLPKFGGSEGFRTILNREIVLHEVEEAEFVFQALSYWLKNPYRALVEGIKVGNVNIQDRVRKLSDTNIETAIICCLHDHLVSSRGTIKNMRDYPGKPIQVLPYGHLAPQKYPRETGRTVLDVLAQPTPKSLSAKTPALIAA